MEKLNFFISHKNDELVILKISPLSGGEWRIDKIYIDQEGVFSIYFRKKNRLIFRKSQILSNKYRIIKATFDSKFDSWT